MWVLTDGVYTAQFRATYTMRDMVYRGVDAIAATGGTARYVHGAASRYSLPVTRVSSADASAITQWYTSGTVLSLTSPSLDVTTVTFSGNRLPLDTFSRSDSNLRDGTLELVVLK